MRKYNILLAYEDPEMLEAIGWALEERGYAVISVSNAEDILRAFKGNMFELLLMDFELQRPKDSDLLRRVKKLNPFMMTILLCCEDDVAYIHEIHRTDVDDYIVKPCSKEKLWEIVASCLKRLEFKRNEVSLVSDNLSFRRKMPDWKKDIIKPLLNNI